MILCCGRGRVRSSMLRAIETLVFSVCSQLVLLVASTQCSGSTKGKYGKTMSTFGAVWTCGCDGCRVVEAKLPLGHHQMGDSQRHNSLVCGSNSYLPRCSGVCSQGLLIGGQRYRILPLTTEAWEERKILFNEKTSRVWPNDG